MNVLDPNNQQNQLDEEQKNLQSTGTPAAGTPMQTPTAQTNVGTTVNKPAAQTTGQSNAASAGGKGSGTYTNSQAYQKANQGATQNISDAVQKAQNIGAQKIGQQIQQKQSEFQRQVDENRQRIDQAGQFIDQTVSGAGQEMDDTAFNRFQNLLSGQEQYQVANPDYSQLKNEVSTFSVPSEGLDRPNARLELLRRTFGEKDTYSSGQRILDDFLLAGDKQAREQISAIPETISSNLNNQLSSAILQSQMQKSALENESSELQNIAQNRVDTAQSEIENMLREKYQPVEEARNAEALTQDMLSSLIDLGLEVPELYGQKQTMGIDIASLLPQDLGSVATQEDLARLNALARLEGTEQGTILDTTNLGQVIRPDINQQLAERLDAYNRTMDTTSGSLDAYLNFLNNPDTNLLHQGKSLSSYSPEEVAKIIGDGSYLYHGGNIVNTLVKPAIDSLRQRYQMHEDYGISGMPYGEVDSFLRTGYDSATNPYIRPLYGDMSFLPVQGTFEDGGTKKESKNTRMEALRKLLGE